VLLPPAQAPKADQVPSVQVRVAVPVQLQVCEVGPLHEQVPHLQSAPQVCEPPAVPQLRVALAAHAPSLVQADQADHIPVPVSQTRLWVPQLPHACDEGPLHCCPPQPSHLHSAPHDCMPPLPQACMAPAAHSFSPAQAVQSDHCPAAQVRDWVPHRPQAWELGPAHPALPTGPSLLEDASATIATSLAIATSTAIARSPAASTTGASAMVPSRETSWASLRSADGSEWGRTQPAMTSTSKRRRGLIGLARSVQSAPG
jgi:hypothetical protein